MDAAGVPIQGGINANMAITESVSVPAGTTVYLDLHFNQYLFVLQLVPGWNLCALPIEPHDSSVAAVLGGRESGDVLVWIWMSDHYDTPNVLDNGKGAWIFVNDPCEVELAE